MCRSLQQKKQALDCLNREGAAPGSRDQGCPGLDHLSHELALQKLCIYPVSLRIRVPLLPNGANRILPIL
jgi:hypothetical protein